MLTDTHTLPLISLEMTVVWHTCALHIAAYLANYIVTLLMLCSFMQILVNLLDWLAMHIESRHSVLDTVYVLSCWFESIENLLRCVTSSLMRDFTLTNSYSTSHKG